MTHKNIYNIFLVIFLMKYLYIFIVQFEKRSFEQNTFKILEGARIVRERPISSVVLLAPNHL